MTRPMAAADLRVIAATRGRASPLAARGFTMIEVLITLVVLALGLLGVIGLQARGQQAELESYQRGQALVLLQDMVDRMNANRTGAHDGASYVTASPVGGGGVLTDCTTAATTAALDLCEWGNELDGAAEIASGGTCDTSSGAKCVGAMVGARGCVAYDNTTELKDSNGITMSGTGVYTLTVTWQGVAATSNPPASVTCSQNLYASETMRRFAMQTMRIANLKSP